MTVEFEAPKLKKSDIKQMMKTWSDNIQKEKYSPQAQEKHAKRMASIQSKLKAGKKLSAEDMQYLQTHDMMAYIHALRVQETRKSVTQALKHAKSKQQARSIIDSALAGVSKDDPDREALMAAISNVAEKFLKSAAYQQLPETASDDDKDRENSFEDKMDDDDEYDEDESDTQGGSLIAGEPTGTYSATNGDQIVETPAESASFDMAG